MPISPGFIFIFRIKPVKDESTVEAAPIRSALQVGITRIPGAEKGNPKFLGVYGFQHTFLGD